MTQKITLIKISMKRFLLLLSFAIIFVADSAAQCTPPTVTANPPNRAICAGSNTAFSASFSGATSVQWQVNTGSGFADISNGALYSGATTNSLVVTGVTAGMSGYMYRLVAYNGVVTCFTNSNYGTLTVSSISTASAAQTNVSCFGGSNGAASVSPTGGLSPYSYSWSPSGGTGSIATGLSAGTYTVTVNDIIGCSATRSFTLTQPTALNGSTVVTNVACNGSNTGAINLTASGGAGGYTYNWGGGITTEDRTGLAAATYAVIITDANGCTRNVTGISVTQPTALLLTPQFQSNISCFGGSNGSAGVNPASGGAGGYSYNWTPGNPTGDGTTSVTGLIASAYTATVTDANGCLASRTFTITQPPAISITPATQTNITCFGGSNGAASINPATGGAGGFTYNWTPGTPTGDGTTSVTGLNAGSWTVTATDANGCTATQPFTVTQPTSPVSGTTVVTNVSCFGGSNGAINLTPSGGTGSYTFNWLPSGPTTEDRTGLVAGTYTVQVTDVNACTGTINATVTQPTSPVSGTTVVTNVSCFGGSNGAINLTPNGGTGPYTFNWLPSGPTTEDRTGLVAGTYTVQVTDVNGCTGTVNTTVTQPTSPVSGTTVVTNVSCFGGSNGAINLTPNGGTGPYTFFWLPSGPTTEDRTGLVAGTYTVQVTDVNGCTSTVNTTVTQPTSPVSGTTVVTNVACFGGSNGAINLTPSGGTGPYTFNWLPSGPTTEDRTGLVAGTYSVQVTDVNGCTGTVNATVTQPTSPVSGTTVVTNVACFGGSNGAINLTPNGGTGPYTFNWLPSGPTTEDRTGLVAGTYSVQVTDVNGCTGTVNATVTQPTSPVSGTTVVTNIACFGGSNGAINLTPSGGTGPYTFNWLPSGPTTEDRTGLVAGTYSVQVTDVNGCTGTVNATVTQPTSPVSGTTVVTNVACFGGSNGAINLTPNGGTGPYTFNWVPSGPTTEDRTGLVAGTYTVQVTDVNGCTGTVNATVTQPTSPVSGTTVVTNVACFGGSNGAINLTPNGGTGPYTFNWLPSGPTTEDRTGLVAGTYSVQVTDVNGCTGTVNSTVTQPPAISVTASSQTNISCFGGSTGAAAINAATGGAGGFTYNWTPGTPTGDGTTSVTGLNAGSWTVTATDANGCTATQTFTVTQPPAISVTAASQTNISCFGGSNGAAAINPATGGAGAFTYNWTPGNPTGDGTTAVSGLNAGNWTVTATDANGCTATQMFNITQNSTITATTSQTNVSCNGGANGTASVNATGGAGGFTYSWAPSGGTAATATGLMAGNYTVTVTDLNGCTNTQTFNITQPPVLTATSGAPAILCNGGTTIVTVGATGGTGTYSGTGTFTVTAGTYTYPVSDANGCSTSTTIVVTEPAALSASSSATTILCNGGSADITVSATGGTGAYTGTGTFTVSAGTYTYTVSDANNCSTTTSITITEPAALVASSSATTILCNGGTADITVNATGGTGSYTGTGTFTVTAGTYTYPVSDANGCSTSTTIVVTEPAALSASSSATTILCNGGSADITVSATGGTGAYTGTGTFTVSAGTYTYTVSDANGCSTSTTIVVTEPATLSASSSATTILCNGGSADITVSAIGGTGAYTGTGTFTVTAGTYTYPVSDANGCSTSTTIVVTEPATLSASSSATTILCNGGTADITVGAIGGTGAYTGTGTFTVSAGTYTYTVSDANNCSTTTSITVAEPTALMAMSSATTILCNGATADVTVSAMNGTAPYSGIGTFTVSAGTYNYTVTDDNGCASTTTVMVTEPSAITASTTTTNSNCGGTTGTATVSATGGTGTLTYLWSSNGTAATETGLTSGTYTVTITDANSCSSTAVANVSDTGAPTVTSTSVDATCNGTSDGSIDNTVTGGTGTITYLWSNNAITEDISALNAGVYTYTATDAAGCQATGSVTISEPNAIDVTTSVNVLTITANNSGTVTYQWMDCSTNTTIANETNQSFTALVDGSYAVIITDGACSDTSACVAIVGNGINAAANNNLISIYPNPNSGVFTIKASFKGTYRIVNELGQNVRTLELNADNNYSMSIDGLNNGIYFMTGISNQKVINQKIVVTQ